MKTFQKAMLILAVALVAAWVTSPRAFARALAAQAPSEGSALAGGTSETQVASDDEAQDRTQEARERAEERSDREQEAKDQAQAKLDRAQDLYDHGTELLDDAKYQQAIAVFNLVSQQGGSTAEGALYWKAYAQYKNAMPSDALLTLRGLERGYPKSRWLDEARQLELEMKQQSGQAVSPESQADDDLKLMALNGIMNSDPDRAVPLLEKFLQGNQSLKLKERALFVLSQSGKPKAREVVAKIAHGDSNPELQMRALNYLGLFGGKESRQTLADIYASSNDAQVKRAILHSFMIGGDRDRLFAAAKSEKSPDLRREAIQQLALTGANSELWQLYQAEPTVEVKRQILQSMFLTGNSDKLMEVARNEKDPTLRAAAIKSLGLMGAGKTGGALTSLYTTEKDPEVKRNILNSLFISGNVDGLIEIARKEKDPSLKREAVQKLSLTGSPKATEYMMEILSK
ncbi:MAG TPA: HEAT repeat domain-containing protein [Terriglobia bacterium]|nr:HEAT repeat domain-containing protein [Terriglobia bacterium]